MTALPDVLGLSPENAAERLATVGFNAVDVQISGRRREGKPRVIRCKIVDGKPELIVSHFKELDFEGKGRQVPALP